MKRRIITYAISAAVSLAIVIGTMQVVRYYVNRIYGPGHPFKDRVTWLVK